jgi:hypothetical protein
MRVPIKETLLVAAITLAGGAVRFVGLDWGLRHPPHTDERVYVENVVAMVAAGDLDHRFYTYPGLFFYLLAPGIWLLGSHRWHGPDAYLASRALVAGVGTLNPLLIYLVGRRLLGPMAAAAAAMLLALSPIDVETCHQVRPDILLQSLGILGLLLLHRAAQRTTPDLRAGSLVGVATAIKFTGVLLWPSYVVARLLGGGPRRCGRLLVASVVIPLLVVACTPFAVIHATSYRGGPPAQLAMYYQGHFAARFLGNLHYYLADIAHTLGAIAVAALAVGTVVLLRRRPRLWGSALLHPVVVVTVMSTAVLVFPRLVIPGMPPVYLAAGAGIAWVGSLAVWRAWRPAVLVALLVAAAWAPARASLELATGAARPSIADRALDWVETSVPRPSVFVESRREARPGSRPGIILGIPAPHEVIFLSPNEDLWALRRLALDADYVITGPEGGRWTRTLPAFDDVFSEGAGPTGLRIRRVREHPRYVDLAAETDSMSHLDVVARSQWHADAVADGIPLPEGVVITLREPARIARIDFLGVCGDTTPGFSIESPGGVVRSVPGRPPLDEQRGPKSLVILLDPVTTTSLRISAVRRAGVTVGALAVLGLPAPTRDAPDGDLESIPPDTQ